MFSMKITSKNKIINNNTMNWTIVRDFIIECACVFFVHFFSRVVITNQEKKGDDLIDFLVFPSTTSISQTVIGVTGRTRETSSVPFRMPAIRLIMPMTIYHLILAPDGPFTQYHRAKFLFSFPYKIYVCRAVFSKILCNTSVVCAIERISLLI